MTTLHHELSGPAGAPVIVLSNSLGTTLEMWDPQIDALRAQFRVLRYDTRGHGRSAAPPGSYTIDELGRDVIALLDSLDIERAHFVGISMGGLTGQWLGVHAGARLDKLVVSNTAARIGTTEGWRTRADLVRKQGIAEVADSAAGRWFTPRFIAAQPATVGTLTARLRSLSPEGYAACCDALGDADLREDIARIPCPTLVIAGVHDPVTTVDDARFITARVSGARLVELDASHLSNIEAADAFTDAVLRFFGD
jgi:3-oxoadipate enol-lactonase